MVRSSKSQKAGNVPALFLHIQKTAGTSIVNVARQFYGESVSSHGEYWGMAPLQLADIRFVSGHMGYEYARHLIAKRFSFTFLRDPAERILSMYYFCRTRDPAEFEIYRKARELDLPYFLEAGLSDPCVRMHIWNNQVWQLAHGYTHMDDLTIDDFRESELLNLSTTHLGNFSYIGFTETFHADAQAVLSALGLPNRAEMPIENATLERPRVNGSSGEVRALLEELTILDRKLYEFARGSKCQLKAPSMRHR